MKALGEKIVKKLIKKNLKISFAESCSGGRLSSAITAIRGSSQVFSLGLVVYSNKSKTNILKVSQNILKKYGAVSKECCLAMVNNLNRISKADVCVSITGIAGPDGGSKKKPVGLVYTGIKADNKIIIKKYLFKNKNRSYIQRLTVNKSLNQILNILK